MATRRRPKKAKPSSDTVASNAAAGDGSSNNTKIQNNKHPKAGTPPASSGGRKRHHSNPNDGGKATFVDDKQKVNNGGGRKSRSGGEIATGQGGVPVVNAKQKRENRKMARRTKQLEAMEKKAKAEDDYFRECCLEAVAARTQQQQPNKNQLEAKSLALFGKQGAQGINFAKYGDIKVEVKPGIVAQNGKKKNSNNNVADEVNSMVFSEFHELKLPPTISSNIKLMNYDKSTPIQRHAIPLGLAGYDLMCCAQTGSGKTCAFLLPVIVSLATNKNEKSNNGKDNSNGKDINQPVKPKCIVLAPTRELALQIELEAEKLCFKQSQLTPVAVYGGASQRKQIRELAFAGDNAIIVATPGRLTDFVDRGLISLRGVQYLILDEADRMLDMGFEPQIRKLVLRSNMTSKANRQTFMFSATFPDQIQLLAAEFLRPSYTWIAVGRVGSTTDSITQVLVEATADKRHKLKLVVEAVQSGPSGRTLIFVQKKKTAMWLKKQLSKGGPEGFDYKFEPIDAVEIHGDRSQSQREAALAKFRSGECRVLVATDVAARGLDIIGVEHVVNMDLPCSADEFDSYVHRIGRTGRAGHTGLATSLYVRGDAPKVGNRKIAAKLIQQLKEANQQVPSFLEAECANGGGSSDAKQRFGSRDVRNNGRGG